MNNEITQLLHKAGAGDAQAADQAVSLLYGELQKIARSKLRHSGDLTLLDTGAVVHEAWMRLQAAGPAPRDFPDRAHFLAYASRVMHSVIVDMVRARRAERRGGGQILMTLNTAVAEQLAPEGEDEILRVHEALAELAEMDPRLAQVVEMRYFGGLMEAEIAAALGVTERTVQRDWKKARLLLAQALKN
ncbi:ECF-type sigma factor [Pelomonas sp. CA6]|uniref:ECF-type sigma factor n=1 Tax=Pelomonas sp. CA6 TaxID=2907999 RepID=UPI001F4B7357|nr:ECF-type sigma factor [Pelomonas sp. CA6]MCH7342530.1 ECF-type sigma factor [Pelomonas sp. CA6]